MEKKYLPERIVASRITLKRPSVELAEAMFRCVDEDRERLARFLPWPKFVTKVGDEADFINKGNEAWDRHEASHYGIFLNENGAYMGHISAFAYSWWNEKCEIGYWLLGKYEGRGFMSEAVTALEKTLFEAGFNRISILFDPQNARSGGIPRRLNYVHEGTLRECEKIDGTFRNHEVYSKIKSDLRSAAGQG